MKLPDFNKFEPFEKLKKSMGALKLGGFEAVDKEWQISTEELKKLETSGLEVDSLDSLEILDDGTLVFKGMRVLVYIRDVLGNDYGHESMPKYHMSNCGTLINMKRIQRWKRYVLSTRTDGLFEMNMNPGIVKRTELMRLDVCKNCLDNLGFNGYSHQAYNKQTLFNSFTLEDFFTQYPHTVLDTLPQHDNYTAPLNRYADDHNEVSKLYRESKNWTCEVCGIQLKEKNMQRFLDTHHINGERHDNAETNLKAVCIKCHADEPLHHHVKNQPKYKEFVSIFGN